jgi:hypothetical protein
VFRGCCVGGGGVGMGQLEDRRCACFLLRMHISSVLASSMGCFLKQDVVDRE